MNKEEIQRKIDENKKVIKSLREENKELEKQKRETTEKEKIEKYSTKIRALYLELSDLIKNLKKPSNADIVTADIEADNFLQSVENHVNQAVTNTTIEDDVIAFMNDPSLVWNKRSGYKQVESGFLCPDCGERLDLRVFDGGRTLLTCNNGFKKSGCKYGYIIKRF